MVVEGTWECLVSPKQRICRFLFVCIVEALNMQFSVRETLKQLRHEIEGLCIADEERCLEYALREAKRFRRSELIETIKVLQNKGTADMATNGPT